MVSLLIKVFKEYLLNSAQNFIFYHHVFFNVNSSFNIGTKLLFLSVIIIDTLMEGTVSQIVLFRRLQNDVYKF